MSRFDLIEAAQLKQEIRTFLSAHWSLDRQMEAMARQAEDAISVEEEREFWKLLGDQGWLGLGIPEEYGGSGGSALHRHLFTEEVNYYGAPFPRTAVTIVAPAMLSYASEEMKHRFLPRIARGEINFALGYTEPEAGTDLANLSTRAVAGNDGYRINGQKLYTTRAHRSSYCWLAARTNPDAKKHAGISLFIVDLAAPGVHIQRLEAFNGESTNITFYDDVLVPEADRVGAENEGWTYITGALGLERIGSLPLGRIRRVYDEIVKFSRTGGVGGRSLASEPEFRWMLADYQIEMRALESLFQGAVDEIDESGELSGHVAAAIKTFLTEFKYRLCDEVLRYVGREAQLSLGPDQSDFLVLLDSVWRDAVVEKFGGGTNEIQRDIVAIHGLGLPRSR